MEDTQLIICIQFRTLGAEPIEMPDEVSTDTGKVASGFLNIFLIDGNGHILILHDRICPCRLIKQHPVVFLTVFIQTVLRHRY